MSIKPKATTYQIVASTAEGATAYANLLQIMNARLKVRAFTSVDKLHKYIRSTAVLARHEYTIRF